MTRPPLRPVALAAVALAAVALAAGGCSGRSDVCHVTGRVSFRGTPVPGGSVAFEPKATPGGPSPAAVVAVKDGAFEVPPAKGILAGRYLVRVNPPLFDYADPKPPLFPPYEMQTDVPAGRSELDVEVPDPKR